MIRFIPSSVLFLSVFLMISGEWTTQPPFYGQHYTDISAARGMVVDAVGDILVLSGGHPQAIGSIIAVFEETSGVVQKVTIVNNSGLGLNHALAINGGFLYASSSTTVYRWSYVAGQRTVILTPAQIIIDGIPGDGDHRTRTMAFDSQNRLYVSVGSGANVDNNSDRARIRKFTLPSSIPSGGINFNAGEVFADGLRNEVALAFDSTDILWGVENGADMLNRPDIGGDIHNGNPAEEFNKFDKPSGTHYGYPYCFTTHTLQGYPTGTQFAWPTFMNDGVHTDQFCRDPTKNMPPALAMPAHMAPLGLEFYEGRGCGVSVGAFPCSFSGDAIVAFHGSWNSDAKVGYRVSRFPIDKSTNLPTGEDINIIYESNANCSVCFAPVNAIFDLDGHLIVTDNSRNALYRVYYGTPPPPVHSADV